MVNGCIYIVLLFKWFYNLPPIHTHTHTRDAANYHTRCRSDHWEQFGVQCLAQGHFTMWSGAARDPTTIPVI